MAGNKTSISDFTIKVTLNSKAASKGLQRLEKQLKSFNDHANKLVQSQTRQAQSAKTAAKNTKAQGAAADVASNRYQRLSKYLKKVAKQLTSIRGIAGAFGFTIKKSFGFLAGAVKSATRLRNLAIAGLGFWGIHSVMSSIFEKFKQIVSLGAKVQQSIMTINAAVGASDTAIGLNDSSLKKLKDNQRLFAEKLATTYGIGIAKTTTNFAKFFAASSNYIGVGGTQDLFKSLTELGVVYGLSSEKMDRAMTAFTQIASKHQVMAEELKQQLGDVLPGSMEIFARAITRWGKHGEVSVKKLYKLMEQGKVVFSDIAEHVTAEMSRMSAGSLEEAMALLSTRMGVFNTSLEAFSTGALNQFSPILGDIFDKLAAIFLGKGFQTGAGVWIENILIRVDKFLADVTTNFEKFEEAFKNAIFWEQKEEVLGNFWDYMFPDEDGDAKVKSIYTSLKENLLKPLGDFFGEVLLIAFNKVWDSINIFSNSGEGQGTGGQDRRARRKRLQESLSNAKPTPSDTPVAQVFNIGDINNQVNGATDPDKSAVDLVKETLSGLNDFVITNGATGAVV